MKKQPLTKAQLQKALNEIAEKELQDIANKHYPEFKKNEGKYFKIRDNYSRPDKPSDYWNMYTKVVCIKPGYPYVGYANQVLCQCDVRQFEIDKYGDIFIREKKTYIHAIGKEISKKEFMAAWNKVIDKINKF